ncbi:MAG: YggS family pyridoxal phosphate-dependent enzyme [Oscillospiraceae bacterium]|jgi:pyridoxal phosphate enzyme (YggS family)|nr:YggS family pyridoxal phosphate-dependent enzyme [Oscillospiraceae bacterium]
MSSIADNVAAIRRLLPPGVLLIAAAKQQPVGRILEAVAAGVDGVGENRVQEMREKAEAYAGTTLHFIGRLQKNKVKYVVGQAALIHSVDDTELARAIARRAETLGITQDILLEVNIAGQASKAGFAPSDAGAAAREISGLPGVRVRGLMCIPPPPSDYGGGEKYFLQMNKLYVDIKQDLLDNSCGHVSAGFSVLSMGMSGDFAEAVRHGATLVRLGSAIFGSRA